MRLILLTFFCLCKAAMSSVLVVGDLEGNFPKFQRYLEEHSEFFDYSSDKGWHIKDGHQLVFMGDAVDKGPGGARIVRVLTQMKKSQPNNVTLLLGNRDVNKMMVYNLIMDLKGHAPNEFLRVPYIQYLNKTGMNLDLSMPLADLQRLVEPFDSDIFRLKVILKGMNAAQAFEHRRRELKVLMDLSQVSDQMVFDDFMRSLEKGGEFYEYLKLGEVIKKIDDTLFVHGGISNENIGKVPGKATRFSNMQEWVDEMNKWAHSEI
ncbi:MAG: metallophosphoesterase, partial [Bacteriovoracaceae bacterium]|nr:metallophosphoesterase [Bacteriovoracaceae bacterium]